MDELKWRKDVDVVQLREELNRATVQEQSERGVPAQNETIYVAYRDKQAGSDYKISTSAFSEPAADRAARSIVRADPSRTVLLLRGYRRYTAQTAIEVEEL